MLALLRESLVRRQIQSGGTSRADFIDELHAVLMAIEPRPKQVSKGIPCRAYRLVLLPSVEEPATGAVYERMELFKRKALVLIPHRGHVGVFVPRFAHGPSICRTLQRHAESRIAADARTPR